jgi:hypothetical protein
MHALVIGVSHYRYLPENPDDNVPRDGRITLGLGQASTPASSALRFAQWLETKYNNPEAPMGSIRLLLSPSLLEKQQYQELKNPEPNVLNASTTNVKAALHAWKRDCEKNRDHVGILYVSGHGIQLTKDDSIVLLDDFAKPNENVLGCAMDIGSIWRAMSNDKAAKIQFYFIDACRIKPGIFKQYEDTPVGVTLDVLDSGSAEASPSFFSAAPRTSVDAPDERGRWTVTTISLLKWLGNRVTELALKHKETQEAVSGGLTKNVTFHVLSQPPVVPVIISLNPVKASQHAKARLQDGKTEAIVFDMAEFTPELKHNVPGGKYLLQITFPPNVDIYKNRYYPLFAFPPRIKEVIDV